MAGVEVVKYARTEWGLQALVPLSFTLQVTLLILAEFRRRIDLGVLRFFVWSAYMLADGTAIYVLGHLSATSRSTEHELLAFWAPFLLLHLGGRDNITAYSIEDSRLWLRHLQTLAVQVIAAAYVIYVSSILGSRSLLRPATILMFVVGVVKYAERVVALQVRGSSSSSSNYRRIERPWHSTSSLEVEGWLPDKNTDAYFEWLAHYLLYVPKELLLEYVDDDLLDTIEVHMPAEEAYKVVEVQLSLMHDVLYTKTQVMCTWCGLCVRIVSLVATTTALLLFHSLGDHKDVHSTLDVAVTYVLLVGAVILEIMSVLRFMFSSWTMKLLGWVQSLVRASKWRWWCRSWSRSMGQHNLLELYVSSRASRWSKRARRMGFEDWWNTLSCSWSIRITPFMEKLLVEQLRDKRCPWSPHHIISSQGQTALQRWGLYENLYWGVEESILVWHIATGIYLCWHKEAHRQRQDDEHARRRADLAKAIEELSNYMLFLLSFCQKHKFLLILLSFCQKHNCTR